MHEVKLKASTYVAVSRFQFHACKIFLQRHDDGLMRYLGNACF